MLNIKRQLTTVMGMLLMAATVYGDKKGYTRAGRGGTEKTRHIQRPRFMTDEQRAWNRKVDERAVAKIEAKMAAQKARHA